METLLTMLLPAILPVASDAVRGIVRKLTGSAGAQPQNVDEAIKLMNAEAEHLKALAEIDKPSGEISRWVADLRASFRYIGAGLVILAAIVTLFIPVAPDKVELAWKAAGSVWSFIFGERFYIKLKGTK